MAFRPMARSRGGLVPSRLRTRVRIRRNLAVSHHSITSIGGNGLKLAGVPVDAAFYCRRRDTRDRHLALRQPALRREGRSRESGARAEELAFDGDQAILQRRGDTAVDQGCRRATRIHNSGRRLGGKRSRQNCGGHRATPQYASRSQGPRPSPDPTERGHRRDRS
jgi:hypothetical protein